jgi:hypothetical protein
MTKECIICGTPVCVIGNPELVACSKEHCQTTVENCIGLHYQAGTEQPTFTPRLTNNNTIINTH